MRTYDDLAGPDISADRWAFLEVPLPDAGSWRYEEPDAMTEVGDGVVAVRVDTFTRSNSDVQILDNPKHLIVSTESFDLTSGTRTFSVEMSAENLQSTGEDYRDGFAAFNVLDMASGQVFDLTATSKHPYAIHERLFVPGLVPRDEAFTHVVHSPLSGADIKADEFHTYAISIDVDARTVTWAVDGSPVYVARSVVVPSQVQIGFGIITLHPIQDERSTSIRGQGFQGRWRNFLVG